MNKPDIVDHRNPVDDLIDRLERWLVAQPEWPLILALPRDSRRRAMRSVARTLMTFPTRGAY